MALENFTTYTETDPNSRITVTTTKVTWTSLTRNEDAHVYADKGVDYFAGNFEIQFTLRLNGGTGTGYPGVLALTNTVDDLKGIDDASGSYLALLQTLVFGNNQVLLEECDSGTLYYSSYSNTLTANTDYYITVIRDETVGTYGTLYCYIYSDYLRTTQVGSTLSITLHSSKKDFRYLFPIISSNSGEAWEKSGYHEALEIVSNISTPTVTSQQCTDVVTTTATGNGSITNLGSSAVTEHGHCWSTSVNPTTADSKTTKGAGSLGAFTSSITGLTQGLIYYVRAYATNSAGTSYGANVSFRAGLQQSQRYIREIGIDGTEFHYIDENGRERYLEGTLV